MADLDEKMKTLLMCASEEEEAGDSFGERAEWYYHKRPQLLALVKDLYNGYLTLLHRCQRKEHKHHPQITTVNHKNQDQEDDEEEDSWMSQNESDTESTISYQQPSTMSTQSLGVVNFDDVVADLVIKNVENYILLNGFNEMEQLSNELESTRKIELLKTLIELLESERVILMDENVRLGYRVSALLEENKGLASEAMFMKRKAGDLARCVMRMREDHRVFILSRKIEDLQGQIYGLEKRNKEYYEQLVKRDQYQEMGHEKSCNLKNKIGGDWVAFGDCLSMEKLKLKKKYEAMGNNVKSGGGGGSGKGVFKWWKSFKNMDLFMCGLQPNST